jgi:hypothetical protein
MLLYKPWFNLKHVCTPVMISWYLLSVWRNAADNRFFLNERMKRLAEVFALCFLWLSIASARMPCPNMCSGHGRCRTNTTDICDCFAGYGGLDCSRSNSFIFLHWNNYLKCNLLLLIDFFIVLLIRRTLFKRSILGF